MKKIWLVLLFAGATFAADAKNVDKYRIKFGAAKIDVTTPVNTKLPCWKRKSKSVAVHDNLYAQVIAVEDYKGKTLLFVRADTMKFRLAFFRKLLAYCKKKYNIPAAYVVFSASHTHNGPYIMPKIIGEDAYKTLYKRFCGAIDKAMLKPHAGCLKTGKTTSDLGVSRRWYNPKTKRTEFRPDATGKIDKTLTVMAFYDLNDKLKSFIWIYGCHNTGYGAYVDKKPQITADWSGEVDKILEKAFPGTVVAFMQGTAGDVKPRFISEKLSKGRPCWYAPTSKQMREFAEKYSKDIVRFIKNGNFKRQKVDFAAAIDKFTLHSDTSHPRNIRNYKLKTVAQLKKLINSKTSSESVKRRCRKDLRRQWHVGGKRSFTWQGQRVRINGNTQILGFSGEGTSGFGDILYKTFPHKNNIIICYTTWEWGNYLTNYKQVTEGGYEPGGMYGSNMDKIIANFYKNLEPR